MRHHFNYQLTGINGPLVGKVAVASSFVQRLVGLLGRRGLNEGSGLLITRCNAVHTFGMRFAIDVIFLSDSMQVVGLVSHLLPWRTASCRSASMTLELTAGCIDRLQVAPGDRMELRSRHVQMP